MEARRKKVVWILCLASLVLAWRVYGLIHKYVLSEAKAEPAVVAVDFSSAQLQPDSGTTPDTMTNVWGQQQAVAGQPWARDPFAVLPGMMYESTPDPEAAVPSHQPALPVAPAIAFTGVSGSDGRWLAIVRDGIVRIGDVVDGEYEVARITNSSITLRKGAWAYRYELGSQAAVVRPWSEGQ